MTVTTERVHFRAPRGEVVVPVSFRQQARVGAYLARSAWRVGRIPLLVELNAFRLQPGAPVLRQGSSNRRDILRRRLSVEDAVGAMEECWRARVFDRAASPCAPADAQMWERLIGGTSTYTLHQRRDSWIESSICSSRHAYLLRGPST